jgi:hypothetical protein
MHTASSPSLRFLVGLLSVAVPLLLFVGCDSSGGLDEGDDGETTVSAEETAEAIAFSSAEATGGTADELAGAAALASTVGTAKDRSRNCSFDDGTDTWTCEVTVDSSRGRADLDLERTYRAQFFAEGRPVQAPAEADSMTFEIVTGTGQVRTPRIDNSHTLLPARWSLAGLQESTRRVVLLSDSAGRDVSEQFSGALRERTRTAEVRKTGASDLVWREGDGLVGGTLEGAYRATVEIQRANGDTLTRSVDATYVTTFSEDGATIAFTGGGERFNGKTFEFDLTTGELE